MALHLGLETASASRLLRAEARRRSLPVPGIIPAPCLPHWPVWKRQARDLLLWSIVRAAFLHADATQDELTAADAELRRGDPRLLFAILTLVNEWLAWALDTALQRDEGSYRSSNPLLARLFRPLGEMLDLWGPEARLAVGHLRLAFIRRVKRGELPRQIDPAWLVGCEPVAQMLAKKLQMAKNDAEELETLLTLLGLKKKGRGPRTDTDRHLYYRILYVRERDQFRSDRQFFHALAQHVASLPPPHARTISNVATWSRDIVAGGFKEVVLPILVARRPLDGTTVLALLRRASPERPTVLAGGAGQE
jgi:hypothetical protein